jgi:hypothetical protein
MIVYNIKDINLKQYETNDRGSNDSKYMTKLTLKHGIIKTVLEMECEKVIEMLKNNKIEEFHLLFWNSTCDYIGKYKTADFENIQTNKTDYSYNFGSKVIKPEGCTHIVPVLKKVKEIMSEGNMKNKDIYIFTDGEVNDSDYSAKNDMKEVFSELFHQGSKIYISTVEPNDNDYINSNCHAGSVLYDRIKEYQQTNFIKKVENFNYKHHSKSFVSLFNQDVPEGYLPFGEKLFLESDFQQFIEFLKEEIKKSNKNHLLKLVHNLSRTIFYMTKNKETQLRRMIINNISTYFDGTEVYANVRNMLTNEIDNHINNKSTTFQEYRDQRNDLIEKLQSDIMEDTMASISATESNEYTSFPVNTNKGLVILRTSMTSVNGTMYIKKNKYTRSCVELNNGVFPVFPMTLVDSSVHNQSLRQWVRVNYSSLHGKRITSGTILNLFLIDMLRVNISNVSKEIKDSYVKLAKIMLEDSVYGSDSRIIDELYNGKELSSFYFFQQYLDEKNIKMSPVTLWLTILDYVNDSKLMKSQKRLYNIENFSTDDIKGHLQLVDEISHNMKYILPEHKIFGMTCENRHCSEKFYLNCGDRFACTLCGIALKKADIRENNVNCNNLKVLDEIYVSGDTENVNLKYKADSPLTKIDDLNFNYSSVNIQNVTMVDVLNIESTLTKTRQDFQNKVNNKYPFLKNLDMQNVCLAGGFCRSILLGQKMKDFDFFFHGLETDDKYTSRLHKLVSDLVGNIKLQEKKEDTGKYKFLFLYKKLYNVFEMIYVYDPTNHFNGDFVIDNFRNYQFKTLKTFDKHNVMAQDKYYFEDQDATGIRIVHRFQFVMCKYNTICDLLNQFDMGASQVAYDGQDVYFTYNGYISYKYMVNIVTRDKYTSTYDSRVSKYLSYGFDLVFDEDDCKDTSSFKKMFKVTGNNVKLCTLNFQIRDFQDNKIIIKHDSHKRELLDFLIEQEKQCMTNMETGLYRSSMFCGLASILRYCCINEVKYSFSPGNIDTNGNGELIFKNGTHKLSFVDKIDNVASDNMWFIDNFWVPPKVPIPPYNKEKLDKDSEGDSSEEDQVDENLHNNVVDSEEDQSNQIKTLPADVDDGLDDFVTIE